MTLTLVPTLGAGPLPVAYPTPLVPPLFDRGLGPVLTTSVEESRGLDVHPDSWTTSGRPLPKTARTGIRLRHTWDRRSGESTRRDRVRDQGPETSGTGPTSPRWVYLIVPRPFEEDGSGTGRREPVTGGTSPRKSGIPVAHCASSKPCRTLTHPVP